MADNEQKAAELVANAEKKMIPAKSFLGGLIGGGSRTDEGLEMYARAANLFKMAKKWSQAGQTFVTLAQHQLKLGSKHDAATAYCDASNCYKKVNSNEAANCLENAVNIYTEMGRFSIAAKHCQSIAEIHENDLKDVAKSKQYYELAADYFKGEESNSSANKCMLKVAQFSAQLEEYEKAIQIYEEVATRALESSLLKYGAKDHFFKASLCHLCVDVLNAQHALKRYEDQFPAFSDSREAKFIKALCQHVEDGDVDSYTDEVKKFDSMSRLDNFYTSLLLRVKKCINENLEDLT